MYDTIKVNTNKEIKGEDIAELRMYEYSPVALGANSETPLLDIKSLGTDDIPLLEDYLRKFDVSNKKGKEIEEIIRMIKGLKEPQESTPEPVTLADPQLDKYKERLKKIKK